MVSCRFHEGNSLVENFSNFQRSREPSRIMFFVDGAWRDFPVDLFGSLKAGFLERRTTVEVGSTSVVEFLRMVQTDLGTGRERSIAWIDVDGRCFFPRRVVDDKGSAVGCSKMEANISISKSNEKNNIDNNNQRNDGDERSRGPGLVSPGSPEEHSDESPAVTSAESSERSRWSNAETVNCRDEYYRAVERSFLSGMRKLDPDVTVSSINRCTFSSPLADGKRKAFWTMAEATKVIRGNANIRYGWYGASSEGLAGILQHGFGLPNIDALAFEAHGRGVHLARPDFLHNICGLLEADDDGERHVLLCRVIVGMPEKVEFGSGQFQPSSDGYDSGVDDLLNPSLYIVWSTCMNTHVIPECVVSFRLSSAHSQGSHVTKVAPAQRLFHPRDMTFSQLFAEIGRSLPPSAMRTLDMLFDRYKTGKIQKALFIKHLRSIAGNKILIDAIKKLRNHF